MNNNIKIKMNIEDKTYLKECYRVEKINEDTNERYYQTIRCIKGNPKKKDCTWEIINKYSNRCESIIEYL